MIVVETYFLTKEGQSALEVTRDEFTAAERAAGIFPEFEGELGSSGFSDHVNQVSGYVKYEILEG